MMQNSDSLVLRDFSKAITMHQPLRCEKKNIFREFFSRTKMISPMSSASVDFLLGGTDSCAVHIIQDTVFRMEWSGFVFAKNNTKLVLNFRNAINWLYPAVQKIKKNYVNRRLGSCVERISQVTQRIQLLHLREIFLLYIFGHISGILFLLAERMQARHHFQCRILHDHFLPYGAARLRNLLILNSSSYYDFRQSWPPVELEGNYHENLSNV